MRETWERDLFCGAYDGCEPFDRPKYGVLNAMNDYRGVVKCAQCLLRSCLVAIFFFFPSTLSRGGSSYGHQNLSAT